MDNDELLYLREQNKLLQEQLEKKTEKAEHSNKKRYRVRQLIQDNYAYLFWFYYYLIITFGLIIPFCIIAFFIVRLRITENLWRIISGVRPLRLRREKERLLPLFEEVYSEAIKTDKNLSPNIELYIQESMDINAFAFGRKTLVLTRGSIELLNDECLKGFIAHELGHFSSGDTIISLFTAIGNLPITMLMKYLTEIKIKLDEGSKNSLFINLCKTAFDFIFCFFKAIEFIGDLIIKGLSRKKEYKADLYALNCGYGVELAEVLTEIYQVSITKPKSVKEQLKSTHPHITKRIERLEQEIY